jgi:hypothetical protein
MRLAWTSEPKISRQTLGQLAKYFELSNYKDYKEGRIVLAIKMSARKKCSFAMQVASCECRRQSTGDR